MIRKEYLEFKFLKYTIRLHKKKLLVCLVLTFIIGNSLLNSNVSRNISYGVRLFFERIIPYGTFDWLDWFLSRGLRKFAHLVEYAVFAIFVVKLYYLKKESFQRLLNTAFICFSVAFLDETIQMFSNRQAKISDVWLDLLGCAIGVSVYCLYRFCRNKRRRIK